MILHHRQRETSGVRQRAVPVVLTIAGSDCSGGAGIQADLKTLAALGIYGTSAITCVVAERPGKVGSITPIPPARVAEQIKLVAEAFPIAAIKTGMLYSAEIIRAVEVAINPVLEAGIPLVVDPVMVASAGGSLTKKSALDALERLIRRAALVTPNRDEAMRFLPPTAKSGATQEEIAQALAKKFGHPAVLVKGGHWTGQQAVDVLASFEGRMQHFQSTRVPGVDPHGTGCTYSAAIAAGLAQGFPMSKAIGEAKRYMTRAIREHFKIGDYAVLKYKAVPTTARP